MSDESITVPVITENPLSRKIDELLERGLISKEDVKYIYAAEADESIGGLLSRAWELKREERLQRQNDRLFETKLKSVETKAQYESMGSMMKFISSF